MTAIVGLVDKGKVWIGGDSAGVAGLSICVRADEKVFENGEFVFGFTSSFRMGQLLRYEFSPPVPFENEQGMDYMVKRFVPGVKSTLRNGGYNKSESGVDSGGFFLVGWRGCLYQIECDYQVGRVVNDYCSVGCGSELCMGSLHTTNQFDLTAEQRIRLALDAACEFSAGVRGPYVVIGK